MSGYKPEGRGVGTRWVKLFLIYLILPAALDPGVCSVPEALKMFLGSKVRGADNLTAICEPIV
jgi:hypothetical protein